ncbi:serine hydrolase domain-containing protein [Planctomicrobium sp. SH668]|uniref:serine hydrolase domain-containing protein n=1 Tax=Planctomicrobium sp. SH668 TaxID=3448126 RepID=UPI003F5B96C1
MIYPPQELLPQTCREIQKGIDSGLHLGMEVYISKNFQTVAQFAWGEDQPGQSLTPDIILPWFSAGKPITAAAIMQRVEKGILQLDRPVADVIPEFAAAGKEAITLEDLLMHTAGLKPIATGWPQKSWDEIVQKICQSPQKRDRGEGITAGYDPARSWFILGEILQRVDPQGRRIECIVLEDILQPLGMNESWMAISEHDFYQALPMLGTIYTSKGGVLTPVPRMTPEYCVHPNPGGGMRGPIRELGLFYEMLLREGESAEGQEILAPETVAMMTYRQRDGEFDATFQHTVDFGLGLIINSNRYGADTIPYGFGRYASESSFGHGGSQSSIGFADPEARLVVTAIANGMPGDDVHNARFRDFNSAIYEDLGLV